MRGSRRYVGTLADPAGKCSVAQYQLRMPSASQLQQLPPLGGSSFAAADHPVRRAACNLSMVSSTRGGRSRPVAKRRPTWTPSSRGALTTLYARLTHRSQLVTLELAPISFTERKYSEVRLWAPALEAHAGYEQLSAKLCCSEPRTCAFCESPRSWASILVAAGSGRLI